MLGQQIWDYAHACDHEELREALNGRKTSPSDLVKGSKPTDCNPLMHRDLMLRLKCTLTKSGRFVNIKSAAYKVKKMIKFLEKFFNFRLSISGDSFDWTRCVQRRRLSSTAGHWPTFGTSIKHWSSVRFEHFPDQTFCRHEIHLRWQSQVWFRVSVCRLTTKKLSFTLICRIFDLMGYKPEHLLGKSVYDFHHGSDSESLMSSFKCRECHFYFYTFFFVSF